MIAGLGFALAVAAGTLAGGRDQPLYQPEAAWVRPVAIPSDVKPSGAAGDVLLWTVQDRLAPNDDETFTGAGHSDQCV